LAVVGAGHLGRIHARLAQSVEGAELVAVVDPVAAQRDAAAAELRCEAFAHHRQLAGQVDAAVVATPTLLHHSVSSDLLKDGIHLLVEKPLTATAAEAEQLVLAAKQQGLVLQVGHVERFNPALLAAQAQLDAPKYIDAVRTSGFSFRSTDVGVVLDLMIHDIDVALWLARSPVRSVESLGVSLFGAHEDVANARLTFASGCVANFSASRASYTAERRMRVFSRRGFASIDFAARTVEVVRPSQTLLQGQFDVARLSPAEAGHWKDRLLPEHLPREWIEPESSNPIQQELAEFVQSVREGTPPRVSGQQGLEAVQVAQRILEGIADHAWDGSRESPRGPRAIPSSPLLRGPHWHLNPASAPTPHREAG
jgi:predicted dehydrogenase